MMKLRTLSIVALSIVLLLALIGCHQPPNRFIILSDLHPHEGGYELLDAMTQHVIELEPAFLFVLGDIGNDNVPGWSEPELVAIRKSFGRLRAADIEIYPIMGNHDVHPRVEQIKVDWFLAQEPVPLNPLFDARSDGEAYRAFQGKGPYDYAFTRGGVHFAVVDSNCFAPRSGWKLDRIEREKPRWAKHQRWMANTFCRHASNRDYLPTLVFLHQPEYMTGDRNMKDRPLGKMLDSCSDGHTVRAVFGGHWHNGENLRDPRHRDVGVYATQVTVHPSIPAEFIVADVSRDAITFHTRDSVTGQPTNSKLEYHAIKGKFHSLRQ